MLSYEFASPNSAVESGAASAEPGTEGAITASSLVAPQAKAALLFEAESEMRALERDLTEIERLDERGVVGPGKLAGEDLFSAPVCVRKLRCMVMLLTPHRIAS